MIRTLIAIAAGIALAFGCVAGFDALSHTIYPIPPGLDFKDPAAMAGFVEALPSGAKAIIAAGWFFAPFLGAAAAIAIGRASLPGWIVASAFLAAAAFNLILIPHPQWMAILAFVFPGLAAVFAQFAMSGRIED